MNLVDRACREHSLNVAAYSYSGSAKPHAPTSFFDGVATTTYAYDANGNLTGTTGVATSTFMWDYRNRMISAWVSGATSTYAYDHTIARMAQITPTTTTHYPSKFYSIEYQGAGTTTATSTAYIFHGDTLVAYIEQAIAEGVATGTPTAYYVHPDHLGSTNVVTDASDRRFIGQFGDDATSLDYLNARYYDPARGQFTSQDPTHLAIGDPKRMKEITNKEPRQLLEDPQLLNGYAYGKGNPLIYADTQGNHPYVLAGAMIGDTVGIANMLAYDLARGQQSGPREYIMAGLKGAAVGAIVGGAVAYVGPEAAISYYNFYETGNNIYDFADQMYVNPTKYGAKTQQMTAANLFINALGTAANYGTPPSIRSTYQSIQSIFNSLVDISAKISQLQDQQRKQSTQDQPSGKTTSKNDVKSSTK